MKNTAMTPSTYKTCLVAVTGFLLASTLYAGAPAGGTIGDRVWMDANQNGHQDAGEPSVPGVEVILWDAFENPTSLFTDLNGRYRFNGLVPGDYLLQFVAPSNTIFTPPNASTEGLDSDVLSAFGFTDTITLGFDQVLLNQDAGLISTVPGSPGEIGDRVWLDLNANGRQDAGEQSVPGVLVDLYADSNNDGSPDHLIESQFTAANGRYRFLNVTSGVPHIVQFSAPPAHVFTLQNAATAGVDSDADPVTGLTAPITLASGQVLLNQDAGLVPTGPLAPGEVGDRVWIDQDQNGHQDPGEISLGGVHVELWSDTNGNGQPDSLALTQQTAANGRYRFLNVPAGVAHMVFFSLAPNTTFTTPNASTEGLDSDALFGGFPGFTNPFILNPGQVLLNQDAGLIPTGVLPPGELGDLVWNDLNQDGRKDPGEPGLAEVSVQLWEDLDLNGTPDQFMMGTMTDSNGRYRFTDIPAGTHVVVEFSLLMPGMAFTQPNIGSEGLDSDADPATGFTGVTVIGSGQTILNQDAGVVLAPAIIGDYVWFDENPNNIQDEFDFPAQGIQVILWVDENMDMIPDFPVATNITNGAGLYSFQVAPLENYMLEFIPPPGVPFVTPQFGEDPTVDSDVDPLFGGTMPFMPMPGEIIDDIDAGLMPFFFFP